MHTRVISKPKKWNNSNETYVDAVLVRRVVIGLGNFNCELSNERFGELSGDDIMLDACVFRFPLNF